MAFSPPSFIYYNTSFSILYRKAYQMRPSIIFFDEIDGIAPVRSSRQDQIHRYV